LAPGPATVLDDGAPVAGSAGFDDLPAVPLWRGRPRGSAVVFGAAENILESRKDAIKVAAMRRGHDLRRDQIDSKPARWVQETARRPVAFAQVREDAMLDRWVIEQLDERAEVLMVASGGCTATALAVLPRIIRLHLVDPNPAQIALSRLKLRLLATTGTAERLAILGHASLPEAERRLRLTRELKALDLPVSALGPIDFLAKVGPDQAGRYEGLFSRLRETLNEKADELTALLGLRDPAEQSRRADPSTSLGRALDVALDSVMGLPNLIGLFGEAATRNRCEPFSRHFARRTRHVLATQPAADNPYLWQMLLGHFPRDVVYPWLKADPPARLPEILWTVSGMAEVLSGRSRAFDFVHLSNILDWLAPEDARSTLELVWSALRPGGLTFIRQLNSNLDIPALGDRFEWEDVSADALHDRDRSFFYRGLHLGRKR
jgi:S-adenosylmethionine-diacylglycerol 3-amino-3-carboxypropyl transferase